MRLTLLRIILPAVFLMLSGCVEVHQLVKMNHDGSGTLTERIRILPRTVRMMVGRQARTGQSEDHFKLLADQAIEKRMKAFGGVTLKNKKLNTLPDGTRELEAVFDFSDINKVTFWMVPTFACSDAKRKGNLKLAYARIVYHDYSKQHLKSDQMSIHFSRPPSQAKFSSPSALQEYRRIVPMFQDMLKDFKFEIQVQAPDDVEQYEDLSMVKGIPIEGNSVIPYRVYGENAVLNPEMIRGFLMGEVAGRIDAYGGDWRSMERALPNTITPYGCDYYGMGVRFLKTPAVVPAPTPEAKK